MLNKIKVKKGFTLLEVITAVFVVMVGIGGTVTLINQTVRFSQTVSSKLIASYLAQEGIEIVKNIRDSNFLNIHKTGNGNWDDGLAQGDWEADYNTQGLSQPYTTGNYLNIDASGSYGYSFGAPTEFKRKINISINGEIREVRIFVIWEEKGQTYEVVAQENLYQWWK